MKRDSNKFSLVNNSSSPGLIWSEEYTSYGWIKNRQNLLNGANLLSIKSILLGEETVSNVQAIQDRSPSLKSFIIAQLTTRYNNLVKLSTTQNLELYAGEPLAVYEQQAIINGILTAGLTIDHTLLDVLIPPIAPLSINIASSVREKHNIKTRNAKTNAERTAEPGGFFIENANTLALSTIQIRALAKSFAELENRNERPDPTANIETLKTLLSDDEQIEAASKFSQSESNKELSTNRLKDTDTHALYFFNTCMGEAHLAPICGQEIKNRQWREAWIKIETEYTKPSTSNDAVKRLTKDLEDLKYNDSKSFACETIDHFVNQLLEAEAHLQIAKQIHEKTPPTQIIAPATIPTPIPPNTWHLSFEQILIMFHNNTDEEIKAKHPQSVIYRRHEQRIDAVLDKLCATGSGNEQFKKDFEEEVNLNRTANTIPNAITRLKFREKQLPPDKQKLKTVLTSKSKPPLTVNKVSISSTPSSTNTAATDLCKTCDKHRPNTPSWKRPDILTKHTHKTKDCRLEHGAKHKKNSIVKVTEYQKIKNEKIKRERPPLKASSSKKDNGSGRKVKAQRVQFKNEAKTNDSDADDKEDASAEDNDDEADGEETDTNGADSGADNDSE